MQISDTGNTIYKKLLEWCGKTENVRAVILTSSRVNPHAKPDVLSDYDIELYTNDLAPFSKNDNWAEALGEILVRWPLYPGTTWSEEWITRLIQFKDGTRIDFQIKGGKPLYHDNFNAGYKVLLDKDNLTGALKEPDYSSLHIKKPSQKEFEEKLNDFFWDSLYVAKNLWRDELFYAKFMFDSALRFNYQQPLIEWHIGSLHNWKVSTNKFGRYFKDYLEPEFWEKIEQTFAGASIEENWTAFLNLIELTGFLGRSVAKTLGYDYPDELEKNILEYVHKIKGLEKSPGNQKEPE